MQPHRLKRKHLPSTERISLTKECGWKDGDRGDLAEWEQTHGKKKAKYALTSTGLLMEGVSSVSGVSVTQHGLKRFLLEVMK